MNGRADAFLPKEWDVDEDEKDEKKELGRYLTILEIDV